MIKKILSRILKSPVEVILILTALFFSVWLMFSTFSYQDNSMLIASKAWSDFASHIPLIRSFSLGSNFPPEYPLFPGEPIKYHFLFYSFVGLLEKTGLRIDWALNLPSTVTFFILLLSVYFFARKLFRSKTVGVLSVIFLLFNGSFAFIEFFKTHPISIQTINDIVINTNFSSFGPYDNKTVSAFWNLNIYTNQRHLTGSISFLLFSVYIILRPILENKKITIKQTLVLGVALGLFFFFHTAVFLMIILVLGGIFIFFPKIRRSVFIVLLLGGLIALPQYWYLQSGTSNFQILLHPGYLIAGNLTISNFMNYWFQNLGLHMLLIPIGFILAGRPAKKIFLSFFVLFIIGNLLQFTPDMPTNHKFFNVFMIIGTMFSAYTLLLLWKRNFIAKLLAITFVLFLTLSGVIEFFPIYNDSRIALLDYKKNRTVAWIVYKTPPDAVFLNNTYLYNPASLAGRKILLGWPYFSWGAGYDSATRDELRKELLKTGNIEKFCNLSEKIKLDYAIINAIDQDENSLANMSFFEENFKKMFEDNQTGFKIYLLKNKCNI